MPQQPFHSYDPKKVLLSWGPLTDVITGFAEGTFIKVGRKEDGWKSKGGADGETTRIQNRNRQGRITIVLKQGSRANAILSAIAQADENSGAGVGPITIMDMSGATPQTAAAAVNAWIVKIPEAGFAGQDEETRTWEFDTDTLEIFIGGN
jgi:hypothetical protein